MKWIRNAWRASAGWCGRTWQAVRPGPQARQGAVAAAVATVTWAAVTGALHIRLGFGAAADFLFAFVVAALALLLATLLVALLLTILRRLPRLLSGFFVGALLVIALLWQNWTGAALSGILLFVECALGAALATIALGGLREATHGKRILTWTIAILALAANVGFLALLRSDGINEQLIALSRSNVGPAPLAAANPASRGSFGVGTLLYGSGNDLRRPEYGRSVAIRTGTVDGSPFLKDFHGWKAYVRRVYWGFGMNKLPLNARVWYPEGAGPFPLVLIVHGNHHMSEFSDPGYEYLGQLLASRGFITASIDENFLNSGLFHDPPKQQAVRGWMLLEHLKLWRSWNAMPGNPFHNKVDMQRIALIGHSRGGEAVATAALFNKLKFFPDDANIRFDYGFAIQSLVAIAPVDGQYKPAGQWRVIEDVNYLTLQGANDADVASFNGSRQWDHVHFTGKGNFFKSELYIYRANHGQFNTVWGRTDSPAPGNWFLNLRPLLSGDQQRQIAKVYLSAFLEATLHERREYIPLFEDYRTGCNWLPATLYANRYGDNFEKTLSNFTEDADVTTTTAPGGHLRGENLTVWREGRIPFRRGDRDYNGVFLGWNREVPKGSKKPPIASYSIDLPAGLPGDWQLNERSQLSLSVAVSEESAPLPGRKNKGNESEESDGKPEATDFSVLMQSQNGAVAALPVSRFQTLLPPLKVRFMKLERLDKIFYENASEPVFQTVDVPLAAFVQQNAKFDPAQLKSVRLTFDRTPSRVLILSQIGIRAGRTEHSETLRKDCLPACN
jgi:dienelactone hydrolase